MLLKLNNVSDFLDASPMWTNHLILWIKGQKINKWYYFIICEQTQREKIDKRRHCWERYDGSLRIKTSFQQGLIEKT